MSEQKHFVVDCRMSVGDSPPTIRIFDRIGRDEIGRGTSAEDVAAFLAANRTAPEVRVHINSTGGKVGEGVAIFNAFRSFPGEIVTIAEGFALSAAALVFLAGARRLMSPGSHLMIHRAAAGASGNAESLRKTADDVEKLDTSVAGMMAERVGKSLEAVLTMMAAETWMNVDEAVRQKFATGRTGTTATMQAAAFDLSGFKNVPPSITQWKSAVSSASTDRFAITL